MSASSSPNLMNVAEQAFTQIPRQYVQTVAPAILEGAKTSAGLGGVPNDLVGALASGSPLGALAGVLSQPDPTMISAVNANPDIRYGDRYVENLVGQSKNGSFIVQSGYDQNAENRGQIQPGVVSPIIWIIGGIMAIVWLVFSKKR